jgi:FkbM family methyltransferase
MTARATPRAVVAHVLARRQRTRSSTPVVFPTGLAVNGATDVDVRNYALVADYFDAHIDIDPGMTVIDVGANIGLFSIEVLQRTGGAVRLLAFEPARAPFAHLRRNLSELFPGADVTVRCAALAERPGDAEFYYRPLASPLSSLAPHAAMDSRALAAGVLRPDAPPAYRGLVPEWIRHVPDPLAVRLVAFVLDVAQSTVLPTRCAVTTLSEVIREHALDRVELLKVDVEGAELDVLRGIEENDWPRIGAVVAEVHDTGGRVRAVRSLLEGHGLTRIDVHQDWLFEPTDIYMVSARRR